MTLDVAHAQGALTSKRYIQSLKDGREVWLNGEKVDVTTHPAFAGVIREIGRLYDLQYSPEFQDQMTFVSPETGNRVSYSWLLPRTVQDLEAKDRNTEVWMEETFGQMGRLPDFCANYLIGLYDQREAFGKMRPECKENIMNYHRYGLENDVNLTHVLGDPQIDRSDVFHGPTKDPTMALHVVEEKPDGVMVQGAKQLATLGPIAQECIVALSATFARREEQKFVQIFTIPINTPGIKLICRDPYALHARGHSNPFSARFDEQDALMIFDDVLVPWERIFVLYEAPPPVPGAVRGGNWAFGSTAIRYYYRLMTFVGVTTMVAEAIGVDGFREVRDKMGELIAYAEMVRLAIRGMRADAQQTPGGLMGYGPGGMALGIFSAQIETRVVEILQLIAASGVVMQPSEHDLENPELRRYLDVYMRGKDMGVAEKSRLFRLAWDLCASSFAMRQHVYEMWHRGDAVRNRNNLYLSYDRSRIVERLRKLISAPLPHTHMDGALREGVVIHATTI
jgi:4-hydroxyphenylacetate 3-monooxygenase oxygenase component